MNYEPFLIGAVVGFFVGAGAASAAVAFCYARNQAAHFGKIMEQVREVGKK